MEVDYGQNSLSYLSSEALHLDQYGSVSFGKETDSTSSSYVKPRDNHFNDYLKEMSPYLIYNTYRVLLEKLSPDRELFSQHYKIFVSLGPLQPSHNVSSSNFYCFQIHAELAIQDSYGRQEHAQM